jgi:AraC-like DNA-binding protein
MRLPSIQRNLPISPWPPVFAAHGPGFAGAMHSHHAMHFLLAVEGELLFRTSGLAPWVAGAGVLTAAHAQHAIDTHGVEMLVIFLDPDGEAGAIFRPALSGAIRCLSANERVALVRGVVPRAIMQGGVDDWVRSAARTLHLDAFPSRRTIHPRVRTLLGVLRARGVDDATSLEVLARMVGLSPSRLMHVFTASIGIPLRPYLAWLRVQRAAVAIVSGNSLTDAAHAAGFADAAHMSRTFRRMLGSSPSRLRPLRCSP